MKLKLTEEDARLIDEIYALSGFQKQMIREVFEYLLIRYAEQVVSNPTKLNTLHIPFIGTLGIKYKGDKTNEDGTLGVDVDSYVSLDESFKSTLGNIIDNADNALYDILKKKIESAIEDTIVQ